MPATPSPLGGMRLEENALAWMAMLNLIRSADFTVGQVAANARISRATLTPPRAYTRGGDDAASSSSMAPGRLTIATARSVQRELHTRTSDDRRRGELAAVSLVGLVARLNMSLENLEVQAPARWLAKLHELDTARAEQGLVLTEVSEGTSEADPQHLSTEELYFRVEAVISRFRNLQNRRELDAVIERELDGVREFRHRYVDPLLRNAVAPPGRGVEAITALARMGLPALHAVTEEIHKPWGFRLYRILSYALHEARGGGEIDDKRSNNSVLFSSAALDVIDIAVDTLVDADRRVDQGTLVDIYPGRSLQLDLLKEVLNLRKVPKTERMIEKASPQLTAILSRRLNNERRPTRERCYAAWLLHHLAHDPAWAQEVDWSEVEGASFAAPGLRWAVDHMSAYARHARWGLADDPLIVRLRDLIEPGLSAEGEPRVSINRKAAPSTTPGPVIDENVMLAVQNHLLQALTTPNGRWRRQVADSLRAAGVHRPVGRVLGAMLDDEGLESWVKDRVCFVIGFMQPDDPATFELLLAFAQRSLSARETDAVEAGHSALLALADMLGLAEATPDAASVAAAGALFLDALNAPKQGIDTRIDLAGAYGLKLIAELDGAPPMPTTALDPIHAQIFGEWLPPRRPPLSRPGSAAPGLDGVRR